MAYHLEFNNTFFSPQCPHLQNKLFEGDQLSVSFSAFIFLTFLILRNSPRIAYFLSSPASLLFSFFFFPPPTEAGSSS